MEPQEAPGVGIPTEVTQHPLAVTGYLVLVLLIIAAVAKKYANQTVVPMWRWVTGRDTRAYSELVKELELVQEQLETSRQERRDADERHSQEIADLREQYESDMRLLSEALAETRRQLAEVLAGVNATRTAVESN